MGRPPMSYPRGFVFGLPLRSSPCISVPSLAALPSSCLRRSSVCGLAISCSVARYSLIFLRSGIVLLLEADSLEPLGIQPLPPALRGAPFLGQRDLGHARDRVIRRPQALGHVAPIQRHGDGEARPGA